jgi:hypothetical protein
MDRLINGIFYTMKAGENTKKHPIINMIGDYRAFECSNRIEASAAFRKVKRLA